MGGNMADPGALRKESFAKLYSRPSGPYLERSVSDNKNKRVVVGMSGGVDSSTAAALLVEQGYEVIGITFKMWQEACEDRETERCCGPQGVADAREVCRRLGVSHYVVNDVEDFRREVVEYFAAEYRAGRTPNPCVMCNEKVKFGTLMRRADQLGAHYVATGHYAGTAQSADGGRTLLKRGSDRRKDQSYFLFSLRQAQLSRALLPLGDLTKQQTRDKARALGLKTADKKESMEICFVPNDDYGQFLAKTGLGRSLPGEITDREGKVLGKHEGIEFFTIGQRRGLKLSQPTPLYVVDLDPAQNRVVVGNPRDLECDELTVERCNWIALENLEGPTEVLAKIRYNHPGASATVRPLGRDRARVKFAIPQRAIAPGQACVFYQDDLVLGGGWIVKEPLPEA